MSACKRNKNFKKLVISNKPIAAKCIKRHKNMTENVSASHDY